MNCERVRNTLTASDDDARCDEATRLHVASCPDCREQFPEAVWFWSLPDPDVAALPPLRRAVAPGRGIWRFVGPAVAAVAVIIAITLLDRAPRAPQPAPRVAREGLHQPIAVAGPTVERRRVLVRDGARFESRMTVSVGAPPRRSQGD